MVDAINYAYVSATCSTLDSAILVAQRDENLCHGDTADKTGGGQDEQKQISFMPYSDLFGVISPGSLLRSRVL